MAFSPTSTLYRTETMKQMTITDINRERELKDDMLGELTGKVHTLVWNNLQNTGRDEREPNFKDVLPNFTIGDFVLVAREDCYARQRLCLSWREPRCVLKPVENYIYRVQDLLSGSFDQVHVSNLELFHESSLNKEAIMPRVLIMSKAVMEIHHFRRQLESPDEMKVQIR